MLLIFRIIIIGLILLGIFKEWVLYPLLIILAIWVVLKIIRFLADLYWFWQDRK